MDIRKLIKCGGDASRLYNPYTQGHVSTDGKRVTFYRTEEDGQTPVKKSGSGKIPQHDVQEVAIPCDMDAWYKKWSISDYDEWRTSFSLRNSRTTTHLNNINRYRDTRIRQVLATSTNITTQGSAAVMTVKNVLKWRKALTDNSADAAGHVETAS